jgi:hypothetical protein
VAGVVDGLILLKVSLLHLFLLREGEGIEIMGHYYYIWTSSLHRCLLFQIRCPVASSWRTRRRLFDRRGVALDLIVLRGCQGATFMLLGGCVDVG